MLGGVDLFIWRLLFIHTCLTDASLTPPFLSTSVSSQGLAGPQGRESVVQPLTCQALATHPSTPCYLMAKGLYVEHIFWPLLLCQLNNSELGNRDRTRALLRFHKDNLRHLSRFPDF